MLSAKRWKFNISVLVSLSILRIDDEGELGEMRITRTLKAIERTDIALLLCEDGNCEDEKQWMEQLNKRNIPVILILNKADIRKDIASTRIV